MFGNMRETSTGSRAQFSALNESKLIEAAKGALLTHGRRTRRCSTLNTT
jgi:hypothetical protein